MSFFIFMTLCISGEQPAWRSSSLAAAFPSKLYLRFCEQGVALIWARREQTTIERKLTKIAPLTFSRHQSERRRPPAQRQRYYMIKFFILAIESERANVIIDSPAANTRGQRLLSAGKLLCSLACNLLPLLRWRSDELGKN
jgi:hypothetical protein